MPSKNVMSKFAAGHLHSGSKDGPKVTNRKQAVAILLSERRKEDRGHDYARVEALKRIRNKSKS
jgi:hypothetical protein